MPTTEQQILLYLDLTPAERAEVEHYVAAHPHLAPLLEDAKALAHLVDQMPSPGAAPSGRDLADYVLAQHLDRAALPEATVRRYEQIAQALAENPLLERQARALRTNLERLATEVEDPVAHFERLTGRRLEPNPQTSQAIAPAFRLYRLRPLRLALAASVAVVMLYGALFAADYATTPAHVRVADLDAVAEVNAGMTLRGMGPSDRTLERYGDALDRLEAARSSTLGLFSSYDADELEAIATDLHHVIDASVPESWEATEALFVLGKIRLHQGRYDDARWALQSVVALDGIHTGDARRLIDFLEKEEG